MLEDHKTASDPGQLFWKRTGGRTTMNTVALIPARYDSSRLKGKPLADICGRPMIWWVCRQVKKTVGIREAYVATDSEAVRDVCREYGLPFIMTSGEHKTGTERIYEAAQKIPADIYVCVNGDEPLITAEVIRQVIPENPEGFFAANLMTKIKSPAEAFDCTNIKVVTDPYGNALFMSRSPVPYPKGSVDFDYYKHLGVLAYSMEALVFFAETPKGPAETAEDINELRFIEHGKNLRMIPVLCDSLSVDTAKDLEYVRGIMEKKLERGELDL